MKPARQTANALRASALWPLFVLALLLTIRTTAQTTTAQASDEYRVEAAFLFHFAQLVDWPPDVQNLPDSSLFLCTVGDDPFQGALEEEVAGKPVGNRTIKIRHVDDPLDMQSCQIVYIARSENKRLPLLVTTLHNAPVLTVGDSANFLDAGGMIRFVSDENKIRFDVNLNAAQSARLKIGSRLLVLAEHVIGESHDK
jgi:hypothetical protein